MIKDKRQNPFKDSIEFLSCLYLNIASYKDYYFNEIPDTSKTLL